MVSLFPSDFTIFAHRGASGHEPENTLRSFARALELGATWIELDVRVVEGEAIVFHDRTLSRRTGARGDVERQSLSFIRSLDAGHGERIPLLSEVLNLAHGRCKLQIELKGEGSAPVVAAELSKRLAEGAPSTDFLVSSFQYEEAQRFKSILPQVPAGLLLHGYPRNTLDLARGIGAVSVHLNLDAVTPQRIAELHAAGLKAFVYTVNDPRDLAHVRACGADGVFTDLPGTIR